jgi:NAD(P)H dehydrogenase (quinone)
MKVAVIFYSLHGDTAALAAAVAAGAEQAGARVRLRQVPGSLPDDDRWMANEKLRAGRARLASISRAEGDDLVWADAVAFGSPGRYGAMCSELLRFLDGADELGTSRELVGKVAGVFCSTSASQGGHESTLLSMVVRLFRLGFLIQGIPRRGPEPSALPPGGSPREAYAGRAVNEGGVVLAARALGRRLALARLPRG